MNILAGPGVVWALGAGTLAVTAEYLYKIWPKGLSWLAGTPIWVPLQLTIGYCVFRMVTAPGMTLLDAFILWALTTNLLRVIISVVVLGETIRGATWVALGLMVLARVVQNLR